MLSFKNRFSSTFLLTLSFLILAAGCKHGKKTAKTEPEVRTNVSSHKLESKYAELLGVDRKDIDNIQLYSFIDDWYGTPYKYGGKNKKGVDCSNFTSTLYKEVYKKPISGTSSSIFEQCKVISTKDMKEGDLVFFKIEKDNISHVGIYLQNNKFVHATTKKGVMIDDLDAVYYKKYFYKAGRLK